MALIKDGFEFWDCEGRPTRIHVETKKIERYAAGKWEPDPDQGHPRHRGLDESSDHTPVADEDDLKKCMDFADRMDKRVAQESGG